MIGETDISNRSALFLFLNPFQNADLLELFPHGHIGQVMHQIVIHISGAQSAQLFVKITIQCCPVSNQVLGELGCKIYLLPDMISFKNFPHSCFTSGVDVGRVKIINPCAISGKKLLFGLSHVNAAALFGKTHTAVTQNTQIISFSIFPVLQLISLPVFLLLALIVFLYFNPPCFVKKKKRSVSFEVSRYIKRLKRTLFRYIMPYQTDQVYGHEQSL